MKYFALVITAPIWVTCCLVAMAFGKPDPRGDLGCGPRWDDE